MSPKNFIYFLTVIGFFIGIVIGLINGKDAYELTIYTCFITMFFYLISHLSISFYIKQISLKIVNFDKEIYENRLNKTIKEIDIKEKALEEAHNLMLSLNKNKKPKDKK